MRYAALTHREGRHTLAEFPDCPGCQTFAESGQDIAEQAREALEGWLESHFVGKRRLVTPRPSARARARKGQRILWVDISPDLSVKLQLRWAREDAGLTQAELARRAGVSQQMVSKIESPDYHPSLDTIERVTKALGVRLSVTLEAA